MIYKANIKKTVFALEQDLPQLKSELVTDNSPRSTKLAQYRFDCEILLINQQQANLEQKSTNFKGAHRCAPTGYKLWKFRNVYVLD